MNKSTVNPHFVNCVEDPINCLHRTRFLTRVTQRKEKDILFCYGSRMTKGSLSTVLNNNTANCQDAYFYVSPSSKEEGISYSTCNFVDLDAGRDKHMKYLADSQVRTIKVKMMKLIRECPLKPHYVVETRNGYQCYWLIDKSDYDSVNSKKVWTATQYYIKQYFKEYADERVGKINQIMRLPYSIWYKKEERKNPAICMLYDNCGKSFRRYNKSLVYNKFKSVAKTMFDLNNEKTNSNNVVNSDSSYIWSQPAEDDFIKQRKESLKKDIEGLKANLNLSDYNLCITDTKPSVLATSGINSSCNNWPTKENTLPMTQKQSHEKLCADILRSVANFIESK